MGLSSATMIFCAVSHMPLRALDVHWSSYCPPGHHKFKLYTDIRHSLRFTVVHRCLFFCPSSLVGIKTPCQLPRLVSSFPIPIHVLENSLLFLTSSHPQSFSSVPSLLWKINLNVCVEKQAHFSLFH